jgi:hypothetical protein
MKKKRFRCRQCKRVLAVRVIGQGYCGEAACQKARKNAWRREKYASDSDYRLNQRDSTDEWLNSVGGAAQYHREYRKKKKRCIAQLRSKAKRTLEPTGSETASLFAGHVSGLDASANSDATFQKTFIKTGRYRICPESANSDAFMAEIRLISYG